MNTERKPYSHGLALMIAGLLATGGAQAAEIEEVVVTAQKRAQDLNELGMDVAVLQAQTFEERKINSVEDVTSVVPGLQFIKSNTTVPVYSLRGVGFYDNGFNAYPTVSVYVDEAPLAFSAMTTNVAFDLERLEVLKGPQGTLFGSNATGGGLNFIAAKPTDEFSASVTAGYGRFNEVTLDGHISGPLSDTVKGRIAFRSTNAEEWQQEYTTGEETGKSDVKALRATLDFDPTDAFRARVVVSHWKDKSDPQAAQFFLYSAQQPGTPSPLSTQPITPFNSRAAGFTTNLRNNDADPNQVTEPFSDTQLTQATLRLDYDFGGMTLTSLTSYADYSAELALDRDGVALRDFDLPEIAADLTSRYQEFRLANAGDGGTRWVVGANYSKDTVREDYKMDWPDSTTRTFFDPPFLGRSAYYTDQEKKNWAVFGNVEHDVGALTFKLGARYTKSELYAIGCNRDVDGYGISAFFTGLSQITRTVLGLPASPLSQVQPNACSLIDNVGILGNAATGLPLPDESDLSESNTSWRAGLDWKVSDDLMVYGNIAKGYKAGSVPGVPSTFNEQTKAVTQESVLSYEAGLKASFLDNRVNLTGAVFYYDYKDKQVRSRYINQVFGLLDKLVNVPKSSIKGLEFETSYRSGEGLTLYANYLWLDAKIDEFSGISAEGVAGDFSGEDMPYAPDSQFAVGGEYEWETGGTLKAFVAADYNYRSETTAIIAGSSTYDIGSYGLLDMRFGVREAEGKWSAWVWGKNLTNEYYWNNVSGVFDTITRYAGRPATYGIAFRYDFK